MRTFAVVVGVLLLLSGGLWALQGAGLVMWPASSFMLQQSSWITYGIATIIVGLALTVWGWRGRRTR